jgi:hypothetical protein
MPKAKKLNEIARHEFGFRVKVAVLTWPVCGRSILLETGGQAQRRGRQPDQTAEADGRCTSRPAGKTCVHFVHNFRSFVQYVHCTVNRYVITNMYQSVPLCTLQFSLDF